MGSAIGVADGMGSAPVSWAAGRLHAALEAAEEGVERRPRGFRPLRGAFEDQRQRRQRALQRQPVSPCTRSSRSVNVALASHSSAALRLSARAGSSCVPKRSTSADSSSKPDAMPSAPSSPHARIDIVGGEPGILGSALEQALRRLDDQGVVDIRQLGDFVLDGERSRRHSRGRPRQARRGGWAAAKVPIARWPPGPDLDGARIEQRVEQLVKHRPCGGWVGLVEEDPGRQHGSRSESSSSGPWPSSVRSW